MNVLTFLAKNWDSVLVVVAFLAVVVVLIKRGETKILKQMLTESNAPVGSIWTAIHGLWKTAITRTERKKDTVKISRRKVRR